VRQEWQIRSLTCGLVELQESVNCILRTQVPLRKIGQSDHFLTRAPILPAWTIAAIRK
jgi:hypothetical protein